MDETRLLKLYFVSLTPVSVFPHCTSILRLTFMSSLPSNQLFLAALCSSTFCSLIRLLSCVITRECFYFCYLFTAKPSLQAASLQVEAAITPTSSHIPIMFGANQTAVCTVRVAVVETSARPVATVSVLLDTCIEVAVRTSPGNHRIVLQDVEMVSNQPTPVDPAYFPRRSG